MIHSFFGFVFRFHSFAAAFYFPDKFHGKFHSTAPAFFSGWQFSTLSVPLDDVTAKHLPASDPDSSIQYQTKLMAREHAKRFRVSFFRNKIQESVEQLNRNRTSQASETWGQNECNRWRTLTRFLVNSCFVLSTFACRRQFYRIFIFSLVVGGEKQIILDSRAGNRFSCTAHRSIPPDCEVLRLDDRKAQRRIINLPSLGSVFLRVQPARVKFDVRLSRLINASSDFHSVPLRDVRVINGFGTKLTRERQESRTFVRLIWASGSERKSINLIFALFRVLLGV